MSKPTDCYVYVHLRASDNSVFYVGKGRGKRAWVSGRRSSYWKRTVAKHGLVVQIIAAGLNEPCAFSIECMVIAKYGRTNLVNLTDGGEGTAGHVVTDAAKAHLRAVNLGKFVSDETRAKISASNMGRTISEEHRRAVGKANALRGGSDKQRKAVAVANSSRQITGETRAKISEARRDRTLHTLVHKEHGTHTLIMSHFREIYGLDDGNLRRLLRGKCRSCMGWRLPS